MVSINYSSREVCCKIVYYGPGLSGKTTNLLYVHSKVPADTRGKMISLATEADRTLYFDFLPINIGSINGFAAKFQLYTVPGQVYYNATRKLVLRGVDGVVFVADSQPDKMDENIESLSNLEENLREYGYDINELPMVIQFNKRDLPGVMTVEELNARLNTRGRPHFEASATVGNGVFDTLKLIIKLVLEKAKNSASSRPKPTVSFAPTQEPAAHHEPEPEKAPYPEPARPQPSQPAAEPVATATMPEPTPPPQPAPAPEPEPQPVAAAESTYRPYPGSEGGARVSENTSVQGSSLRQAASSHATATPVMEQRQAVENVQSAKTAPTMAPSVKRRADKEKKRGFFKRLFGIK